MLVALTPTVARGQSCVTLQYSFQPDCYRPDESSACAESVSRMDLGPQIAVWLQDSTGTFVDTLMVTNATSVHFGATAGTSLTVVSDTQITVTSPAGSVGVVPVTVTTPGGTSTAGPTSQFTYT